MSKAKVIEELIWIGSVYPTSRPVLRTALAALQTKNSSSDMSYAQWVMDFKSATLKAIASGLPSNISVDKSGPDYLELKSASGVPISIKFGFDSNLWLEGSNDATLVMIIFGEKRKVLSERLTPSHTPSRTAKECLNSLKVYVS